MHKSVDQFLDEIAQRGSWLGGGSVAALSAALSAALLEKLTASPQQARRIKRIRQQCVQLIEHDASTFASVIHAMRARNRRVFVRCLKAATEAQYRVFAQAQTIRLACRRARQAISPRLQSDVRCAQALAEAAGEAAQTLIRTNVAWLNDRAYTNTIQRRLRAAQRLGRS